MNEKDRIIADYNRNEIEKRIKRLCAVARGTDASLLSFICDASGKYSDRKLMRFINDIVVKCGGYKGKQADFFKAFLYCCIRCPAEETIYLWFMDYYNPFRACSTFQDILDKARLADMDSRQTWMQTMEDLMLYEHWGVVPDSMLNEEEEERSFFIATDRFIGWLTKADPNEPGLYVGKDVDYQYYRRIDPEGFEKLFKDYSEFDFDNAKWWTQRNENYRKGERTVESRDEGEEEDFSFMDDESFPIDNDEPRYPGDDDDFLLEGAECIPNSEHWYKYREEFADINKFMEMYRKYRRLFFEVPHSDMYERIEEMIYIFMYENGLSVFVNNKAVVEEFRVIDSLGAQLKTSIRRSMKRNGI